MAASRLWTVLYCGALVACSTSAPTATPGATATVPLTSPATPVVAGAVTPSPMPSASPAPTETLPPMPSPSPAPTETLPPMPSPSPAPEPREGLGWSAVAVPQIGKLCCWQIASAHAGFLIFAGDAEAGPLLITSTNGTSWRVIDSLDWPGGHVQRITDWDGAFLAVGTSGSYDAPRLDVWQSPDGRTWRSLADLALPASVQAEDQVEVRTAFAVDGRITVIVDIWPDPCTEGCDGPIAVRQWTSSDNGASWRSANLEAEQANHDPALELDGVSVRVSRYWDYFENRTDGTDWQIAWLPGAGELVQPERVRLTSVGFVGVGAIDNPTLGLVLNSVDGLAWTQSKGWPELDAATKLTDIAQFQSLLVAVGYRYGAAGVPEGYVLVSPPLN